MTKGGYAKLQSKYEESLETIRILRLDGQVKDLHIARIEHSAQVDPNPPRTTVIPYLHELFTWIGVGWIIALFLGLWGAMLGVSKFIAADLFFATSGIIVTVKLLVDALSRKTLTRWLAFSAATVLIASLELGILIWTHSLSSEAKAQQVRIGQLDSLPEMRARLGILQSEVETYGPKLQEIIDHPESQTQKDVATALLNRLKPKIQIDEPFLNGVRPAISFLAEETNVGGSIAKGESSTANAQIDAKSKEAEERLFSYLYDHENDADVKPKDMNPGYGSRSRVLILSRPDISPERLEQLKGEEQVYIGVLSTYFDEAGRKYHSERCMYFNKLGLDHFCDGHNTMD